MVDPADRSDEDGLLAIALPSGPRRPGTFLVVLITIVGVALIAAPFTLVALGTRHVSQPDAGAPGGGVSAPPGPLRSTDAAASATPRRVSAGGPPLRFSAITGPGCPDADTAYYRRAGDSDGGRAGWLRFGTGCAEQADAMPMSGDPYKPDPGVYAEWDFRTDQVQNGSCDTQVYIPGRKDIVYNGGNPAHYVAYDAIGGGNPVARFTIMQQSHLGTWVPAGHIPISHGELRIQATDEGQDWDGSVKTYRHISAGPVKVACS